LDFSPVALAAAQGAYGVAGAGGSFVAGEALNLPFAPAAFDVVMSTGLLEHFADPLPIVLEMVRVLRPGGVFYSDIVPRKFSLFRAFDWFKGSLGRLHPQQEIGSEEMYERSFSGGEICNLLGRAGLARPQAFAAGVIPPYVPLLYRIRWLRLAEVQIVEWTQSFWKALDGTRLAEWLGFYYFSWATKP
jgi:SAM-dependent methyltransferase